LKFSGLPAISIFPDNGENPSYLMWSNRGDVADTTLTKDFDLTGFSGPLTLHFNTWYDLETDFDFTYLEAKVEGGDWQVLQFNLCSNDMPADGTSGCLFTGQTSGWQVQTVDLSVFAGQKISLRFEMVSDGGVSNEGFAVDDLSIPEIGYAETFESGDGGWAANGFTRIRNVVPQSFLVSLITADASNPIRKYQVNAGEELNLQIDPNCFASDPILVVSGNSRFTRQTAQYTITLTE
jgi:immune inhibitor A